MSLYCRKVLPKFDNKSVAGVRNRLFAGAPNIKSKSKVKMQKNTSNKIYVIFYMHWVF